MRCELTDAELDGVILSVDGAKGMKEQKWGGKPQRDPCLLRKCLFVFLHEFTFHFLTIKLCLFKRRAFLRGNNILSHYYYTPYLEKASRFLKISIYVVANIIKPS